MSNVNLDKLLDEIYSIEKDPNQSKKYYELWSIVRKHIYTLPKFKAADTGLKKASIFNYNNMFIWNTKTNSVSTKKILSPFKNNFIKLRKLYNAYKKELDNISKKHKLSKQIMINVDKSIISTEVIINMLYLYGWNINRMKNEDFKFIIYPDVYYKSDISKFTNNLISLNKNKDINIKLIGSLTVKIVNELTNIIKKTYKLF